MQVDPHFEKFPFRCDSLTLCRSATSLASMTISLVCYRLSQAEVKDLKVTIQFDPMLGIHESVCPAKAHRHKEHSICEILEGK